MDKIQRRIYRKTLRQIDPRCMYCGTEMRDSCCTLDHVVPAAKGGPTTPDNLVLCCTHCNQAKRDRSLQEWVSDLLAALQTIGGVA